MPRPVEVESGDSKEGPIQVYSQPMLKQAGKYIADTLTKFSIENAAGFVASMIGSALMTWWISADPRFPVESRPALAIWFLAIALALGVLWVLIGLGFRHLRGHSKPMEHGFDETGAKNEPYDHAHQRLMDFVFEYMLPAVEAQRLLQIAIIEKLSPSNSFKECAEAGLVHRGKTWAFNESYRMFAGLANSPPDDLSPTELVTAVDLMEKGYAAFVNAGTELARSGMVKPNTDSNLSGHHENWRVRHNAMVEAYDAIKRKRELGPLYRPLKPSRWGGMVFRTIPSGGRENQEPQDTPEEKRQ